MPITCTSHGCLCFRFCNLFSWQDGFLATARGHYSGNNQQDTK